jgi:chromate transport protein ChrA
MHILLIILGAAAYLSIGTAVIGFLTSDKKEIDGLEIDGLEIFETAICIIVWPCMVVIFMGLVTIWKYTRSIGLRRLEHKQEQEKLLLQSKKELTEAIKELEE